MTNSLSGTRPAFRTVGVALAAALLVPLLAACGSESAGGTTSPGAGNGAETSAPPPTPAVPYCGLKPEGQDARTEGGMTFPATLEFIGKSLDDARALAVSSKLELRVVGEDGVCNAITDDLRTDRVNVYLEDGTVVAAGAF